MRVVSDARRPGHPAPVFLLYGPPGTSKTTIARGLAAKTGWDLIQLSPSDFVVGSLDQIEQRSREIFDRLMNVHDAVVLFDEMDTLLRDREALGVSGVGMMIEFVVPALLPKLQDFCNYTREHRVAAFFVTNYYERLDSAITRAGRIDNHILVLPYTDSGRRKAARMMIKNKCPRRRPRGTLYARLRGILNELPCNLTYQDLDWLSTAIVEHVNSEAIERKCKDLRRSQPEYDAMRRPKAFRELYSFMKRYEGHKGAGRHSQITPLEACTYFAECQRRLPYLDSFFSDWVKVLSGDGEGKPVR